MFSTCVCGTRCTCADFWLRRPASVAGTQCRSDNVSGHCCRGQGRVFPISSLGDGGGGSRRGSRQGWHRRSFRLVDAVGELVHDANRVAGTQREVRNLPLFLAPSLMSEMVGYILSTIHWGRCPPWMASFTRPCGAQIGKSSRGQVLLTRSTTCCPSTCADTLSGIKEAAT